MMDGRVAQTHTPPLRSAILTVGSSAPDFTGTTDEGEPFRLAEWLGTQHLVLYFYVRDLTKG